VSHKGIRLLIEDTAKSLGDDIQFTYARESDANLVRDKRYPFIALDPLNIIPSYTVNNVSNFQKTFRCAMAFVQIDQPGSTQEEYSKKLDEMDTYVDNFLNRLNTYAFSRQITSDDIVITNITQEPFIKNKYADGGTGWMLFFNVQVTDQFNYCGLNC
jgi:hypothetical protein